MRRKGTLYHELDWLTILFYLTLAIMGWANIYAAIYDPDIDQSIVGIMNNKAGNQFLWILVSLVTVNILLLVDYKVYFSVPYLAYGLCVLSLVLVLIIGEEIKGNQSWIKIGPLSLQPAEFAKVGVALAVAKYLSDKTLKYVFNKRLIILFAIIFFPPVLILMQPDTGSALVFSSFIIVLYMDGLPQWIVGLGLLTIALFILSLIANQLILIGVCLAIAGVAYFFIKKNKKNIMLLGATALLIIGVVTGTNLFINNVLQPHQQRRIEALIDPESDPKGAGWNIIQSKIAISDGGLNGKGYTKGVITKGDFVPEQHTDFIFCTIGEEHGFIGTTVVILIYLGLLFRLFFLAGRQKSKFIRIYGYSVASIFFFHFTINIGMTIGLFPVIGIPLPFFSYGGSSLWAFSILLFIFLKLDMHRNQMLARV